MTSDERLADGIQGQVGAAEVWRASEDEIVISSRFLEWVEENLSVRKD
ncbi:MAG: hypothetical protein K2I53_13370 [Lachnospiraceae bacterium]|nr:hypothetical protein [Lachnospiraceae bacterium]